MTTNTKAAHTPGPWETGKLGHNVQGANGRLVAATMFVQFGNNSEDVANARLIAAAPDLLAALIECRRWLAKADADGAFANCVLPHGATDYALPKADAAIAAAKGESG